MRKKERLFHLICSFLFIELVEKHLQYMPMVFMDFVPDNIIGKGGCSEVYRGMLWNGCTVAIKSFSNLCDSERAFFTEMEIVRGLQHPHIVRLIGYCISDCHRRYLLVYTFAPEGDLEQKLHGKCVGVLVGF